MKIAQQLVLRAQFHDRTRIRDLLLALPFHETVLDPRSAPLVVKRERFLEGIVRAGDIVDVQDEANVAGLGIAYQGRYVDRFGPVRGRRLADDMGFRHVGLDDEMIAAGSRI